MDTVAIRHLIEKALDHENNTHELARLLQARLQSCSNGLSVKDAQGCIVDFVGCFIKSTPTILDALEEISRHSPDDDSCEIITAICTEFFIAPPPILAGRQGLNGMMARAYLCHRFMEEISDSLWLRFREPLLPIDFTCLNLVIHQLIGEPVANLLDELVEKTVARLCEVCDFSTFRQQQHLRTETLQAVFRQSSNAEKPLYHRLFVSAALASFTVH